MTEPYDYKAHAKRLAELRAGAAKGEWRWIEGTGSIWARGSEIIGEGIWPQDADFILYAANHAVAIQEAMQAEIDRLTNDLCVSVGVIHRLVGHKYSLPDGDPRREEITDKWIALSAEQWAKWSERSKQQQEEIARLKARIAENTYAANHAVAIQEAMQAEIERLQQTALWRTWGKLVDENNRLKARIAELEARK